MEERLKEITVVLFLLIIGIPLFILFLPFIILFLIFDFFQRKRFKKNILIIYHQLKEKNSSAIMLEKTGIIMLKKTLFQNLLTTLNIFLWKVKM